jgi:hypothetical protein
VKWVSMKGGGHPFAALRSALGASENAKRWATLHVTPEQKNIVG